MDLPLSAAPRRRAPPQGRLCGRSPARFERRRVASLVAVPAGAPVSVARRRPHPKGTKALGRPAPCVSRASPDPVRRPSTCRTVRPRRGPGAGGTHRQPSPARPAVAAYGISPRSRCGLPEPRQRGRPVHNPGPDIAGFEPQRSGPLRPTPALGTGRFRCYSANRVDSFVDHVPLSRRIQPPRCESGSYSSLKVGCFGRARVRGSSAGWSARCWPPFGLTFGMIILRFLGYAGSRRAAVRPGANPRPARLAPGGGPRRPPPAPGRTPRHRLAVCGPGASGSGPPRKAAVLHRFEHLQRNRTRFATGNAEVVERLAVDRQPVPVPFHVIDVEVFA